MPLHLRYREVALANIDQFDRLGAFQGQRTCCYHYVGTNQCCAVGVSDPGGLLAEHRNKSVLRLVNDHLIVVDDLAGLQLIQDLHDWKAGARVTAAPFRHDEMAYPWPPGAKELILPLRSPAELTPDIYKEVMRLIVMGPTPAPKEDHQNERPGTAAA